MAGDWKDTFRLWAKPFSENDEEKASNAARMINEAIREWPAFTGKSIDVYPSGSYRNNTNTRKESDVDVAVVLKDACYYDLPSNLSAATVGFTGTTPAYALTEFRDDVEKALVKKFSRSGVSQGDKAFDVHENSYRLDADVAVFLEYRRYTGVQTNGRWDYESGVEMRSRKDASKRIINWHQQHYEEGVRRNDATKRRFKRITRILKRVRDDMRDRGSSTAKASAKGIASFLLECLVFNCPDSCFNRSQDYDQDTKAVLQELAGALGAPARSEQFVEVNRKKLLLADTQPWSRTQAHEFVKAALVHIGA